MSHIDVIPGILEKEWAPIEEKLRQVTGLVDWVQVDIADNTLVPNETFIQFVKLGQLDQPASPAGGFDALNFEAHLMVANPEKYIKPLVDAGFKRLIAHVECNDIRLFLEQAKYEDVEVGIAIDAATPIETVEPFLEEIDMVLVMTIEAGFSGQEFMPETVEKIKSIHEHFPDLPIEVDGGINDKTAKLAIDSGATRLVSTSFLFKDAQGIAHAIAALKNE